MKKRSHIFRGIASIFLALLVILQIVAQVANSWQGKVNELLGVSEAAIRRSGEKKDYSFISDFETPSKLIQAQIDLNKRLAAEGTVVLKGTPVLKGTNVTLFGMRSGDQMQFGGSMGELTDVSNVVTLDKAMEANGFSVNPAMVSFYQDKEADYSPSQASGGNVVNSYDGQGAAVGEVPVNEYNAADLDGYRDAAVVVFGRDAGESCCFYPGLNGLSNPDEFSNSPTGNILSLSDDERELLAWIKQQDFGSIVVLLNSSTAMEIEELKRDAGIDSIIWIGNPGAYGTYGVAELLSGQVLPSGHLPDTFAVNSALSPASQNYGIYTFSNAADIETTTNHALRCEWYLAELETIYTGYRYYETRYFDSFINQGNASLATKSQTADGSTVWNYDNEVSYSFGYGVEGSSFSEEITDCNIDWSGDSDSAVTIRVTNTGNQAAKHVVQLYVSVPYTDKDRRDGVEKSAIQLIGYAKTGETREKDYTDVVLLEPGKTEDVTISFNAKDFYSYDMTYQHDGVTGAYVLEGGDYCFATGNGAHDAVQAVLKEQYPEIGSALQPTGAVYTESLSIDTYLTQSNGTIIQNQLTLADLNSLNTGTTVTYLTRNDWANTFPSSVTGITATEEMIYMLRNETYRPELANYSGPTEFTYGTDNGVKVTDLVGLDYNDPLFDKVIDEMSLQDLINQYLSFRVELPNIGYPVDLLSDSPLGFIATIGQHTSGSIYEVAKDDPAFGYHTNTYVSAPVVAATFSPSLQEEEGRMIGNDALWTGYSTWLGPGVNLHRTPYNGRNLCYYSEDSVLTGRSVSNVLQGAVTKGLTVNAKHFAFNDQETNRDGIAVFLSEQAARENELRGFQIPIRSGNMSGLMSAFNRIGCTHVAASQGLMNNILRGEWGFNGYLVTDAVKSAQYFLPRECLLGGNDSMLGGSNNGATWNFTEETVAKDPVLQAGIRESFHRKLYFYVNSNLLNGMTQDTTVGGSIVWWKLMLRILRDVAAAGTAIFAALFIVFLRKERGVFK